MTAKKLIRIKDIFLSTTILTDSNAVSECDAARKLLNESGIKFQELWYNDPNVDERTPVLNALSTWTWKSGRTRSFNAFPILHWTECYDDWSTEIDHAMGLEEIQSSILIQNINLIS